MKPFRPFAKLSIFLTGLMVFIASAANATTYFSFGNADPAVLANWWTGTTGTGTHPGSFGTAADVFTVQNTNTYTTTGTWTIAGTVAVSAGGTLIISAGNAVTIPTLTITGTGSVTNNGSLTISTNLSGTGIFVNGGTGTLNYGSATTISVSTFTVTAAGNTVNYNRAGTQTVKTGAYVNLTLSGTSAKTTTTVTVNGILTMGGTASVTTLPTYGAASTLYYDGTAAQTTGTEFPASFLGSGGVVSNNALGVTMNALKTVSKLTVNAGASFSTGATNTWTLTVSGTTSVSGTLNITNTATKTFTGDVTVFNGGNFLVSSTSKLVQTHNLIVNSGGTITHNQVYDNASTILEVLGNLDINGTYVYTGFTPAVIMDAASGTFNINAQNTSLYQLFLKNSIYKCTGNLTVDNQFYAMWNLDLGEFHTNGFNVTATTWGLVNAGGTVFVDGGSLSVGGAVGGILSGHTGPTGANAHITISSGTLTTTGLYVGIAPGAFTFNSVVTQSGGTVNVNGPIVIDGSTTPSKYLMSGGTLNANGGLSMNSPAVFTCTNSPIINVGGSWINTGTFTPATSTVTFNGAGAQTISNSAATSFNNLIINPSAGVTVNVAGNNLTILNNLTVTTGIFDMSTFTCNQTVAAGTFNLASGTQLRLAGSNNFPSGYTTINLNATAVPTTLVEYYGTIPQSVSAQTYGNLTVSNNSTKTAAGAITIKGDLNINSSSVFAGSTFSHSIAGNWYNNVSTSAYAPGTSTVTFNGSSAQTIGGTAGTTFNNLTINNGSGVNITQDQTVNSTLTLSAGNLTIASNNLIFGSSALPVVGTFSATRMIVAGGTGEVRKNLSAIGTFTFPIGDNSGTAEYSPITLNYTAGSFAGGAYTGVNVTDSKHPNNASTTDYLTRYWTVSNSGITTPAFNVTATYLTADITGTESNIAAAKYTGSLPWIKYPVIGSNTLSSTGNTNTGTGIVFTGITNSVPNVTISGGGVSICNGGSVSLGSTVTNNGTSSISYAWTPSTGLSSTTISNPTASPTSTITYSLTVTDGNGIASSPASTTITVYPVTVGGSVSGGAAVCSGTNSGTLTLSGQTGSVVRWEFSTDGGTTWTTIVNTTTTQTYTNLTVATLYRAVVQSGVCTSANSASASMTINPVSVGGSVSGGAAVCSGTNSGTLTLSGQTGSVVRWEFSTDGGTTWTTIVNTTTTQTYTNLTLATLYRAVVQSGVCTSANSASASMTINPVSVGGSVSGGGAVCSGTNSGTLTLSGQTGSVVRWEYSTDGGTTWTTIVNTTTTQTYTNLTVATLYRAVVQSGVCTSANSASASMTINPVSVGGSVSGGAAVCSGTNSGTLTVSGQTGSVVRWEFSTDGGTTWTTIVNTTTTQTYTNLTVATLYRAVVQSGVCTSANSASASMTINPVSVGGSVSGGAAVCSGTNSGTLTLSGQTGSVVRWEKSTDGGTTWTTIVNTTTTQTYTNLTVATLYRAVVQSGVCTSANSASASMTINPVSVGGSVSGGAAVCSGTNSGTLTLSGQTGSVVRWEFSTDGGTTWTTIVNTTTTQTYTNLTVATLYRAVVQSGVCTSANSASASMTINPVSVGGSVSGGAAVCSGTNSGTLTLSGQTGSVVRWEFSTDGGTTWTTIVNTTTTQTYTNLTVATLYRAVVQSGVCTSANSASASMTINPVSVGGSVSGGAAVCSGTNSGTLTLSGQTGSVVRWEFSTDGGTTWTTIVNTTTTQTYTNLTVATLYRAVVQSGVCTSANSASASMTINPVSVGGSVSGGAAVCSGTNSGTLTLSGQTGSVVRWEYSTDGGTTWTTIVNTTTTQTYTNLTVATLYRAVVQSGVCTSANSASASMTINPVSVGGSVSGGAAVCSGTNSGTLTLSGQTGSVVRWEFSTDGGTTWTTIVNTTTTQTYTNLTVATLYRAVVQSGVCTSANSASASMTINPVSVGGSVSGGAAVCSGTNSGTLTLSGQTGSVVRWEYSTDGGTTWTTIVNTTTTQTYTNLTVATLYRAVLQSGVCTSANSASASMTINPVSVGGSVSGAAAVCSGTNSGTLTLSGQTGSVVRWEYSTDGGTTWTTIVNTTTTQTYTNLTVATLYRAVVQSGVCTSANSASASMTINPVSVGGSVSGGAAVCSGTNSGTLTLSGQTGSVVRWEKSTDGGTTWTTIVNTTTTQTYTNLTVATLYRAVVQSGVCTSANSASASMTINPVSVGGSVSGGAAVCSGTNSGTLTLSGQTGSVVRWEFSTDGGTTWTTIVNTTTTQTYTNLTVATVYRAVVQSGVCTSANSASASMTINPVSVGGSVSGGAAVCSGTNSGTLTLSGQTGSVVRWEKSTDGGTTWTTIVNTTTTQTYTNLTVSTLYRAVVQSGVCTSANSASASIIVTIPPSATISYSGSPYCSNTGSASVTLTGTVGGVYSVVPSGASINSSTGLVNLVATPPGSYTVSYTVAAAGGCSLFSTSAALVVNPNTWTGGISTDWNTAGNWVGNAIPTISCPDVTILAGVPYQPILSSGIVAIQNLYINSGASLTVTNATLQLSGTINNSGTFDVSNGAIELNSSSAQSIPASAFQNNALKDLIISNSSAAGVTLGGPLDIYSSLIYTGAGMTLTTNDNLTLKSTALNTAWIGDVTGNTITGKVTVERFISARKAWRFLSIPTNTTQTIQSTWQEGAVGTGSNPVPGYGIQITGPAGTAAGFDLYSSAPSMKTYVPATNTWISVPNTSTAGIKATDGYMTFIRGDRAANLVSSTPTQTVLRTKGNLYVGDQTPILVSAGKFASIGNPYASALDMRDITKTGLKDFFYVWDPQLGGNAGFGAYQTFYNNGSDYCIIPGGGSYGSPGSVSNYIESGQAFFVQADVLGGSLTFKEAAKTSGSSLISVAQGLPLPQIRANLYGVYSNNTTYMADGVVINYDDGYSNGVDGQDAIKSINTSENLSVKNSNTLLVVERRHSIVTNDTIFLNLTGVKYQKYRFVFNADQLNQPGVTAFLEDAYLNTSTPIDLNGNTTIDFTVGSAPASSAANRFRIVFTPPFILPLTFTSIKAYPQNADIAVEWNTANESNMQKYEVEKSVDGNHYTTVSTVAANNATVNNYNYLDTKPSDGNNYYRILSTDLNGKTEYSKVVKVFMGKGRKAISIYPNPVTDRTLHLQFNNEEAGTYGVKVLNKAGQLLSAKQLPVTGNTTASISLDKNISSGIYQVDVLAPDGTKTSINISVIK